MYAYATSGLVESRFSFFELKIRITIRKRNYLQNCYRLFDLWRGKIEKNVTIPLEVWVGRVWSPTLFANLFSNLVLIFCGLKNTFVLVIEDVL